MRAASTARRSASSLPISGRGAPAAHRDRDAGAHEVDLAAGDEVTGREQLVDRVGREHHDVERLAGLHARGGVDAADRFDRDALPRASLVGARQLGEHRLGRHRRDAADRVGARALNIRHPYMLT